MGLADVFAAGSEMKRPGHLIGAASEGGKSTAHRPFEICADQVMIGLCLIAPHIAAASIEDEPQTACCRMISMPMQSNTSRCVSAAQSNMTLEVGSSLMIGRTRFPLRRRSLTYLRHGSAIFSMRYSGHANDVKRSASS